MLSAPCWYWKVTRSLVSYDSILFFTLKLIINWKVTRSLVSYDRTIYSHSTENSIERSPDHWWVTTLRASASAMLKGLKGHQIIGELRLKTNSLQLPSAIERSPDHWWVTTWPNFSTQNRFLLKGHQIIGELRLFINLCTTPINTLKGHQIIGELRQRSH